MAKAKKSPPKADPRPAQAMPAKEPMPAQRPPSRPIQMPPVMAERFSPPDSAPKPKRR